MKSFVVKGKAIRYFWIPVGSVLVAYFATVWFFNFVNSNPEKVMSIWAEILVTALYLCVCRCCIIALEFYVTTVLSKVTVDGREITIKKFLRKPVTIDVKKLDGYRIEDITDCLDTVFGIMKIVILYNGDSVSIVECTHKNFDDLFSFLKNEAQYRDKTKKVTTKKPRNLAFRIYYKIFGIIFCIIDIPVVCMFIADYLFAGCRSVLSPWTMLFYSLFVALRLMIIGGPVGILERTEDLNLAHLFSFLCITFYYLYQMKYTDLLNSPRTNTKVALVLTATVILFFAGEFIRHIILWVKDEQEKYSFFNVALGLLLVLLLMNTASYGAGMVFTTSEPTYENVTMNKTHSKLSGSKYKTRKFYIDVEYDDGTKETFTVKRGRAIQALETGQAHIKIYHSIFGYDVKILEVMGLE
ncbi:hypothetical protein [Butyrivibrio sp. MB2005]|uniref:hypothetical protein n=1 Tax=Butyrivibrio sp. MB2005 TaxID=1280678 RepID=UPI00047EE28B|nr:hypothetical protein [Butyrivibrio sp. MB2005]